MPGGLLLWSTQLVKVRLDGLCFFALKSFGPKVKGNPIDRLIKEVLLEDRLQHFQNTSAFKLVQNSKFIFSQQERVGETFATLDSCAQRFKHTSWYCSSALQKSFRYNLKWKLLNEMDLFFVVVYQGILQIAYLEAATSVFYVLIFLPMFSEH